MPREHSTIQGLVPASRRQLWPRRVLYGATTAVLAVIVGVAAADGLGVVDVVGVDSATVEADGGGYHLSVEYGVVSRPALATPFEIVVSRSGGFDGPVTIAADRAYLKMWDENGLVPDPSSSTADRDQVIWEFEPPDGDVLAIFFDARIEPAVQSGRPGWVAVLGPGGETAVQVDFETRVLP